MPFNSSKRISQSWVRNGLVGAWCPGLTGTTGVDLFDLSGYNNNGVLTNMDAATDWVSSDRGLALDFDGTDDYLICPSNSQFNPNLAVSCSHWVYPRVASGTLVSINSSANTARYGINAGSPINIGGYQIPTGGCLVARAGSIVGGTNTVAALNTWNHMSYTYDGNYLYFYINGVVSPIVGAGAGIFNLGVASNIQIGRNGYAASEYSDQMTASLYVYNRVLSPNEILKLYLGGPGYGLIGYGEVTQ